MLILKKVRYKNFRSYGNIFTEVNLERNRTTVISGKNGSGKTSCFHAITFALFGKVPGVKKPKLINDINNKDCLVEIEFSVNGKEIFIRRGMKPVVFEIVVDGVSVNQDSASLDYQAWLEESILGFNIGSFMQVVSISGSTFTPFFLQPAGERRKTVEDLLNITVFSKMYAIHTGNMSRLKDDFNDVDKEISKLESSITSLRRGVDELMNKDRDFQSLIENQIIEFKEKITSLETKRAEIVSKIETMTPDPISMGKLKTKIESLNDVETKIKSGVKSNQKFLKFLNENSNCPTCSQELNDDFTESERKSRQEKLESLFEKNVQLQSVLTKTTDSYAEMESFVRQVKVCQQEISKIDVEIKHIRNSIQAEEKKLKVGDDSALNSMKDDLKTSVFSLNASKAKKRELNIEKQYLDLQTAILKDSGIKTRIVKQIIPKMNADINKYLNLLELGVHFEFDENFNETIFRRFKDPSTYTDFSAGEKSRIDIALLFSWREVAKAKNSLNCNVLFLDEIFDNTLDELGLDTFVNLLKNNLGDTNVYMISHRPEIIDKFDSNMRIGKHGNFSVIE